MIMVINNLVKDYGVVIVISKVIINDNINLIIENVICIWMFFFFYLYVMNMIICI